MKKDTETVAYAVRRKSADEASYYGRSISTPGWYCYRGYSLRGGFWFSQLEKVQRDITQGRFVTDEGKRVPASELEIVKVTLSAKVVRSRRASKEKV